ncbi:unnamed protein product [Peronospora effusa]|uniref:Uncharacterized protein n=1 Tax=Peronospora effusa TaxID=542832 RepID=A0A3M6VSJ2_9STRA|nr:hypothetical protein DD238_001722 [Peronospora effusa]RQM16743.1 hypothetical protein DD237_000546 [Peronospora effusa]CAI5703573.1 unnamed protein product [Peronospora effusa]
MPAEQVQSSNAPYSAAQPTPNAAMKMQPTLPPIAMAQPLGVIHQTQPHLHGGSKISVNPNAMQGIYHSGVNSADPNHPYVTVMAMAPPGASGDAQADNVRFAYLQRCRWMAGCLMAYYAATFFFLQPFLLGIMGLATALMGFNSSRSPMDMYRLKWLRWYIRANYVMLCLNMWTLVVTLVFMGGMSSYEDDAESGDIANSNYNSNNISLFLMMLVAFNTIMHLRCLRMAQLLVAELVAAGVAHEPVAGVVAANNPVSAV